MKYPIALVAVVSLFIVNSTPGAEADPKQFPTLQAIPQPYHQASFQRDALEIARYHFSPTLRRPFVYPLIGPSNRPLTRMGHPHDPESHSHHNSVWISHNDVNGMSFWDDRGKGRIVHQRIEEYEDQGETSWITTLNNWLDEASNKPLLQERRRTTVRLLPNNEFWLIIDLQLESKQPTTLGKTPFGLVGVRMAKTIGVNDGGGSIRNSENQSGEKDTLWQRAKWLDYSGPITPTTTEGITLMDHPKNPNHPTFFHTRADGWMGASLTYDAPRTILPAKPLTLRYALWVHAGKPSMVEMNKKWGEFAQMKINPPRTTPQY
ncbi:MAG: PmoA family protein [Planctomycetota bacterium]|nr:PmoA family protein [Planctomycetota bacterium]